MKIHFSNVDFSSRTGPNTFGSRLADQFEIMGHDIIEDANLPYDVFLAFIEPASLPRPGSKFIHRLDGIWFKPEQFETHNKLIKWSYQRADRVICISEFNKNMVTHHWGHRDGVKVINNGIDLSPVPTVEPKLQKIHQEYDNRFICSANWHKQKRLKSNVDFFLKFRDEHPDQRSCLTVLGHNPDYVIKDDDIWYAGNQPHDLCLQLFRDSDWMLHLAWLDHCPNSVVEAMSQNCGIVCASSGGTKEAVGNNGVIVLEKEEYAYQLTDYDNPPEIDISKIVLPENLQIDNSILDIRKIAARYIKVFEE